MIEGGLSPDMLYRGSNRRGYSSWPGAFDQLGKGDDPFPISAIIQSGFGMMFAFNWGIEQQSIMFQIVGGTDRLPRAFAERVRDSIELARESRRFVRRRDRFKSRTSIASAARSRRARSSASARSRCRC